MIKKLALALTLTAATASAEVTMDDQNVALVMTAIAAVADICDFDLTAEANTTLSQLFALMSSKYSETVIGDAVTLSWRQIREQRDAAASDEAWCAEKLSLFPEYWSEMN